MGEKTFLNQMKTEKRFALGSGAASQQKFGKCLNAAPDPDDLTPMIFLRAQGQAVLRESGLIFAFVLLSKGCAAHHFRKPLFRKKSRCRHVAVILAGQRWACSKTF